MRDRAALTAALVSTFSLLFVMAIDGWTIIGIFSQMTIAIDVNRPWLRSADSADFLSDEIAPGEYFALADEPGLRSFGIWLFNGQDAQRVDVGHGDVPPRIEVPAGKNLIESLRAAGGLSSSYFTVQRLELPPGAYYPGMARPDTSRYGDAAFQAPDFPWRRRELIASLLQLRSLYRSLETIFAVVHPSEENLAAFGNSIRELIILASTECEAQWKAVLKLNNYHRERPTRSDYQKLGNPMRLSEFTVVLQHYQDIGLITPFAGWDGETAGFPLPWYDDYNAVKHDRAGSFTRATLASALNAVAACWVMIAAQYGYRALRELPDLQENIRIQFAPRWRLSECYLADSYGFSPDGEQAYPF